MSENNGFAFIGGDLRQFFMAEELLEKGFDVCIYGIEMLHDDKRMTAAMSLEEATSFCKNIVCPVPFSRNKKEILSSRFRQDMTIENLLSCINKGHKLFGGSIPEYVIEECESRSIQCFDFMKMEEVAVKNAVATAEGAIAEAVIKSPVNLHRRPCIVLGFGRCAKVLASKLKGMGACVSVAARSTSQLAVAEASGYAPVKLDKLLSNIGKYDFIFNTIPSMILDSNALELVKKGALIIDIASKPGGTDFEKAGELGIDAYLCLGLPGKYAPKASAEILSSVLLEYTQS